MSAQPIDVSFITINYNSSQHTIHLIDSIVKQTQNLTYEIIIVDNDSEKQDSQKVQDFLCAINQENIHFIQNSVNAGFASGNMLGVSHARGRYFYFINNDTVLLNNAAKILFDFIQNNHESGLCTTKILEENQKPMNPYKLFPTPTKQLFGKSLARYFSSCKIPKNSEEACLVEVVSGSSMFVDADFFIKIGGLDTTFFLYCEEEDLSRRVWKNNKKVFYVPQAIISHLGGGSTQKSIAIVKEYYISYFYLIHKHFNSFEVFVLKLALYWKLFLRIFKQKYGFKVFLFVLRGAKNKQSLRYKQNQ